MPDFDWNDLRAFLAVARIGRLTVAARHLGIDHSTLSRRLASLEAALRTRLFDRRSIGFVLTSDGERLIEDAEQMENLTIRMRSRLEDAAQRVTGTVRLGTPEGFGTYFLSGHLPSVVVEHPDLNIELVANPRTFSLSKREADLAVSMTLPASGRVYARKLVDYALGIYASGDYLEAHGPVLSIDAGHRHCWVGYVEDLLWTPELDYLPHIDAKLTARVRISNVITQMAAIKGGVGLGILPHFMARNEPGLRPVLSSEVRLIRSYWLVTHAETRESARVRLMADFITSATEAAGDAFWLA